MLDKQDEANQLLSKYNMMLRLGGGDKQRSLAQGELTPSQLLTSGEKVAKVSNKMQHSSSNHLVK